MWRDVGSQRAVGLTIVEDASNAASETVLEGEASSEGLTTLGGEGFSGDTAISGGEMPRNKATTNTENPGDGPRELDGPLTLGEKAASMYNSAVKETLQMKKVSDREKYVFIPGICNGLSLTADAIGQLRTFTMGRLRSCAVSWHTPAGSQLS